MGLSNGEKQTINILCLAEQILEHFVAMVGGRWVGKRFAAKCVSRENGKLLCGGDQRGEVRNIILCKLLLIQAIHNFALTNYLSKLCQAPAVESTSSAA